ncbi:MAG TPA: type II toxin-antitoxin system HipA family toxin [Gemmatimonadaceae bacterium]|nr:type II toxin-antitoxin system HipA family toxin [Gemmatimonadaceae bacterium]
MTDAGRPASGGAAGSASAYTIARVEIWGQPVGVVAEDERGEVVFEYAEAFRTSGLELSPIHLPLSLRGPVSFPQLRRVDSFQGLPGLLADSLPDAFGNAVIRRYFEARGTPESAMSPVQKLLYIGDRAMGALQFRPQLDRVSPRASEALQVAQLVAEARRVIEGDTSVAVPEMMQVGASAGGARAKALILWNRDTNRVRSGFASPATGDESWLIKFDGVTGGVGGHAMVKEFAPGPFGRMEYVYSIMARAAGVDMADTHLLHDRDFAHFMTRRFDRRDATRLHMHTLGGMHHVDYAIRQALSYEDYFRTIRLLGMGQAEVDQGFRRMAFNIAAHNQDDHVKNLAFLMGPDGRWMLAPAYDVSWADGGTWARTHQMTAHGKDDHFTRDDLLAVGQEFDVPKSGADILQQVDASLDLWKPEAARAGLSDAWITRVGKTFRRLT